jgi:hypothetical protein
MTSNRKFVTGLSGYFTHFGTKLNAYNIRDTKYNVSVQSDSSPLQIPQVVHDPTKTNIQVSDDLLFMFLKKGTTDVTHYFNNKSTNIKLMLPLFASHVSSGLRYMHHCEFIHNDLKPDNIIFVQTPTPTFQLIDFGLTISYKYGSTQPTKSNVGSPYMFFNSSFFAERSFLFDWHCLYVSILQILGAMTIGQYYSIYIDIDKSSPVKMNGTDLNQYTRIEYISTKIRPFIIRTLQYFGITDFKFINFMLVLAHAQACHSNFFYETPLKPVNIELFDESGKLQTRIVATEKAYEDLIFEVLGKSVISQSPQTIRKLPVKTFLDEYQKY